jgi:predicted RNA-binding protein YlqC (UPF0109 family)
MTTDYAGLVEFIVKNIVESPDAVVVDGNSKRHRSQTVEVRLDPADVGRVIGKGGKNIEAIRAVVKAAAIKDHTRVNVEVVTEDDDYAEDDGPAPVMAEQAEPPASEPPAGEAPVAEAAAVEVAAPNPASASVPEIGEG